jgi:DNA-binding PadR family transcriptional regulator
MGPLHGYGIARRIEQISQDALQNNQGTIYASLVRLGQKRWISGVWGASDNNRRAKFYASPRSGGASSIMKPRTGIASRRRSLRHAECVTGK